jgi:hypothetical protein
MCVGSLLAKPKAPAQIPEDASVAEQRARMRSDQQRQIAEDKQKQFEMRVAAYTGKQGRKSLLSGRRGGQGFQIQGDVQTRDTLGV